MYEIFEQDVAVNVHYQPLPMLSYYKHLGYNIDHYPVSFKNYEQEISLPVYYDLTDNDVDVVCNAVIKAVEKVLERQEA
jgi:dTDP-4-amino-4,6-dideoxygalactose transaminase